ncbi:rod shape-determining protein MreC [Clostridium chauvoei]|uniref:Cell shape-determining protein MreC n=2 Tax=Clostridium chauvoei TaxID=46867 RepID=A0A1U6JNT6_9CLOT|nr:rod shape-determining protein MreC [Clostridium chauvoei]ATD55868.1 rod shape-determining protein MreC [Clostridium chauvoei]ATD56460.1 rod shape-determining protein MreC [Clostridium chauvoei]MBX7280230.1 rod shape-determining protein MreC [Clostridium chauvoei]MBX7282660.1 rod shape-determining protein MreC [Clostridium chauvoei]MBX7285121.1 rod shape-determining protein MreC [Clostridium chauvoei]
MKFFKNKLAVTIIVLSVAFLSVIVYTVSSQQKDIVSSGVGSVVSPLQKVVYKINDKIKGSLGFVFNFSKVKQENEDLANKNIELENKLLEYDKLKDENERLREVLNFKNSKNNYDYLGCEIIGYSGGNFTDGYIIDKGEDQGLKKGMVVIANKGLVGQVTSTGSNWAIVESLINENIAVSVMVNSTRETTGILKGYRDHNNQNLTQVTNLPMDSAIKEGDVILTLGLGQIYPKEVRIGEVISVETDNVKVMKSAIVKPYVDFNKLEELFVVVPKETREIKYKN